MTTFKMLRKSSQKQPQVSADVIEVYPTDVNEYDFEGRIGKGAFASVFVAKCLSKNTRVAIKVIELERTQEILQRNRDQQQAQPHGGQNGPGPEQNNDISLLDIQKEASIMARMHHPNIVRCLASFNIGYELWLIMPLLRGSCADIMQKQSVRARFAYGFRDELVVATIMKDILQGIAYFHFDGRVHRDIKAANILLSNAGVASIADFGVSGAIVEGGLRKNGRHTFTGSLWWMAPEVLQRENKHSYSADIWSLGITAIEIFVGRPPHFTQRPVKVMLTILQQPAPTLAQCLDAMESDVALEMANKHKLAQMNLNKNANAATNANANTSAGANANANGDGNALGSHGMVGNEAPLFPFQKSDYKYGKKFRDFLSKCLEKDQSKRISAKDLLNHSFVKQAKNSAYLMEHVIQYTSETRILNKILPNSIQKMKNEALQRLQQQQQQQQNGQYDNHGHGHNNNNHTQMKPQIKSLGFDLSDRIGSNTMSASTEQRIKADILQLQQNDNDNESTRAQARAQAQAQAQQPQPPPQTTTTTNATDHSSTQPRTETNAAEPRIQTSSQQTNNNNNTDIIAHNNSNNNVSVSATASATTKQIGRFGVSTENESAAVSSSTSSSSRNQSPPTKKQSRFQVSSGD